MSHFSVLVITTPDSPDAESLLAPYDENHPVPPYQRECYCAEHNLRTAVNEALTEHFGGNFDTAMRQTYVPPRQETPEEQMAHWGEPDPDWQAHIKPWTDKEAELTAALADKKVPDPECEDCHGTGFYLSRYNKDARWDWYELGGRWTGFFTLTGRGAGVTGRPGLFTEPAADGKCDQALWAQVQKPIKQTFAFITPDGVWHQKADMGWWGLTANEDKDGYQQEWDAMIASLKDGDTVAVFDLHI